MTTLSTRRWEGRKAKARRFSLLKLKRCQEGSTAVEMSLIALPFFLVIFGIIEVGYQYFADRMLNASVDRVARMIRTGEVQDNKVPLPAGVATSPADTPADKFRKLLCAQGTMVVFNCEGVVIDVVEIPTDNFSVPGMPQDANGDFDPTQAQFNPGTRLSVNLVRAYYQWPTFIDWKKWVSSSDYTNGRRLLVGSAIIRNEPYNPSEDDASDGGS